MAKVIMNKPEVEEERPSEKIIKKGKATYEVVDELGRIIKVRAPSYLERTDFISALGERGESIAYLNQVMPAMYVKEIDGTAVFMPTKLSEVRAILQKLDDEGVAAVIECVVNNIIEDKTEKEAKEKVKKS